VKWERATTFFTTEITEITEEEEDGLGNG